MMLHPVVLASSGQLSIPPEYGIPFATAVVLALIGYVVQRALKNRPAAPTVEGIWLRLDKVEKRLEVAEDRLAAAETREAEVKGIVRDWMRKLMRWDRAGRSGQMPLPSKDHMKKLGISDDLDDERNYSP